VGFVTKYSAVDKVVYSNICTHTHAVIGGKGVCMMQLVWWLFGR